MAAEVPTFYDQWPQRLWMKVTVASSPEETESSLPLSLIRASNSSSGHSSSLTVAICSSSCENLIRQRILIRICLANILWFHILCKQFTFFFFCRAFIASRFRRNFSLCSASLTMKIEIKKKGNKNGLSEYLKREGGYIKISVIFGLPLQLLLCVDAGHDGAGHPGDPEPALQLRLRLLLHDCNLYLLLRSPAIRSVSFMLQGAVFQI